MCREVHIFSKGEPLSTRGPFLNARATNLRMGGPCLAHPPACVPALPGQPGEDFRWLWAPKPKPRPRV